MNSMEFLKAFGEIDDELIFDAADDGAEGFGMAAGSAPAK